MVDQNPIAAIGLLSARRLERVGAGFHQAYPVAGDPAFEDLLLALDRIEWTQAELPDQGLGTGRN